MIGTLLVGVMFFGALLIAAILVLSDMLSSHVYHRAMQAETVREQRARQRLSEWVAQQREERST